jgi:hypothetical protein
VRAIVVAGLVLVALGVGLWLMVVRDDASAAPEVKTTTSAKNEEHVAPPSRSAEPQARRPENVAADLKKSFQAQMARDDRPAPSLAPEGNVAGAGSGSAKVATPEDRMRWAMMRTIRSLEPAIIDCLDEAKKTGGNVDGVSAYSYFFTKKGDDVTFDHASVEYGPYSEETNTCIQNAGKTATIDRAPEGATQFKVFGKLTVENGDIKNLQMPAYHVLATE